MQFLSTPQASQGPCWNLEHLAHHHSPAQIFQDLSAKRVSDGFPLTWPHPLQLHKIAKWFGMRFASTLAVLSNLMVYRAPTVDTAAAPYILHHKRLRSLAVEGYQMKDSLMLPEGRPRWVIISRAITEAVGLSYDDCTSGRFCKGPNDPGFDQRMQTVIKACHTPKG